MKISVRTATARTLKQRRRLSGVNEFIQNNEPIFFVPLTEKAPSMRPDMCGPLLYLYT